MNQGWVMLDKIAVAVVVAGGIAYFAHERLNRDPTVFALSKAQAESLLVTARTSLPRRDGDGKIEIWGVDRTDKGVKLNMKYFASAPLLECGAVVTALAENKSRVVPDCGGFALSGSAVSTTQIQLRVPMFEEHIQATLAKRPFDRARVDRAESAIVMRNMGDMRREALQEDADMRNLSARTSY